MPKTTAPNPRKNSDTATKSPPTYRRRPGYDQAIVTLTDARTKKRRDYWLGPFNSPESRELYHCIIAEWEANDRRLPAPPNRPSCANGTVTVNEIALLFWRHACSYYGSRWMAHIAGMIRITRRLFGTMPAESFGPNALRRVRDAMVRGDTDADPPRRPWSRPYVNSQIHLLCRMFKWAASHEMISAGVYQQLKTVPALRKGRSPAGEPDPVLPVPIDHVQAVRS